MVASYVLCGMDGKPLCSTDAADGSTQRSGGAHRAQGLLSFFEIVTEQSNGPDGFSNTEVRFSLLLHGVCAIPSVATSLAVAGPIPAVPATPAADSTQQGSGTAGSSTQPLLLAGCQDGVHAFSVRVDDVRNEGRQIADLLLDAAKQPPSLPPLAPASVILEQIEASSSAAAVLYPGSSAASLQQQGPSVPSGDEDEDDADEIMEDAMRCVQGCLLMGLTAGSACKHMVDMSGICLDREPACAGTCGKEHHPADGITLLQSSHIHLPHDSMPAPVPNMPCAAIGKLWLRQHSMTVAAWGQMVAPIMKKELTPTRSTSLHVHYRGTGHSTSPAMRSVFGLSCVCPW